VFQIAYSVLKTNPFVGVAVIPDFMAAIDNVQRHVAEDGIVGVADFFTSAKYDLPNRQHSYLQRWFWRSMFDVDGIGTVSKIPSTKSIRFHLFLFSAE